MTTTEPPAASPGPDRVGQPQVPPPGAGAASPPYPTSVRQPAPPGGVLRTLLRLPVHLYHAHLGVLLGHRFLLLVHTGRKTGMRRETVLEVVRYDPISRESVVAAGWGRRTGWLHNVEAGLAHEVRTGRQRFAPVYRILPPDEAERLFADYERRNRLIGPLLRAVLSRLLGWRYNGTPTARRRAVEQLSLVAFRPHDAG
jgi:deazaflavin-dependent oxidoreductase (nitroreductase family)